MAKDPRALVELITKDLLAARQEANKASGKPKLDALERVEKLYRKLAKAQVSALAQEKRITRIETAKLKRERANWMFVVMRQILKDARSDDELRKMLRSEVGRINGKQKERSLKIFASYQQEWAKPAPASRPKASKPESQKRLPLE